MPHDVLHCMYNARSGNLHFIKQYTGTNNMACVCVCVCVCIYIYIYIYKHKHPDRHKGIVWVHNDETLYTLGWWMFAIVKLVDSHNVCTVTN